MLGLPPLPRTLAAAERDVLDAKESVRLSALRDLVRLSRDSVLRTSVAVALERVLLRDASAELRAEAAVALADAELESARDALVAALDDREPRVRQMAVLALGELAPIGDEEVAARLAGLRTAEEAALRFQALVALERIAPQSLERELLGAAADSDDEVRAMAFRIAERRFCERPAPAALLSAAQGALTDATSAVRAMAGLFLAAHGESNTEGVIIGVLDGSLPAGAAEDVQLAIELAVQLRLDAARPALARRAFGPLGVRSDSLAWHSCIALARLGDERARRAILRGLGAWTHDARTLAVVAAGQARLVEARELIRSFRGDPRRAAPEAVEEALRALADG